ncbi:hypothetical protein [Thalassotalea eurytherma]|uniref:hypothetical protein n=1 Tax=Thalassotalea eurytherma TaxID=1144278 RepID=UPI0024E0A49A|nr:hypothetical protein [Thalassotalea eurytherma]
MALLLLMQSMTISPINLKIKIKHNVLILVVQDTAPGAPDDELDNIFERLYRAVKFRNRSQVVLVSG